MKVRIKSFNGELQNFLTLGKEYEFTEEVNVSWVITGYINPDYFDHEEDEEIFIFLDDCIYLNGGSWEVVE